MENRTSKVMIVDDEPAIVKMVSTLLESRGYHIQTACDGVQALGMLKKTM